MHPTPDLSHLKANDYRQVYEPAEDTFLLLDAIEADIDAIRKINPTYCLEIGSGSGCVTTFMASLLGPNTFYMCTDINDKAAKATRETGNRNKVLVDPLITKFSQGISGCNGKIDLLLFNPPYVVTPSEEVGSTSIEAAWAGGIDGREVIDEFIPYVKKLLSPKGLFYLVVVEENRPMELIQIMETQGFRGKISQKRTAGREKLFILQFTNAF